MTYNIRTYTPTDYPMIASWWSDHKATAPDAALLSTSSTFVLEANNEPVLTITVYLTNCLEISYLENFCSSPTFKGERRKEASQAIVNYATHFAKLLGYKRIVCLAPNEKLFNRYQELGMKPTLSGLHALAKEI